jgi:chemotaxis protein MotA
MPNTAANRPTIDEVENATITGAPRSESALREAA